MQNNRHVHKFMIIRRYKHAFALTSHVQNTSHICSFQLLMLKICYIQRVTLTYNMSAHLERANLQTLKFLLEIKQSSLSPAAMGRGAHTHMRRRRCGLDASGASRALYLDNSSTSPSVIKHNVALSTF